MSLNLNTNLYSLQGVDTRNVANVSSQILKNAQNNSQAQVVSIDYSKFNRNTLGIDLYSSRTSVDLQRQISFLQAGLYTQAIDVAQLNASAAANLYSASTVAKNVELTQSVLSNELTTPVRVEELENNIEVLRTSDKNAGSSNGFNPFEAKSGKKESEK